MTKLLFIHSRLARIADNHGFIRGLTRMRSSLRGVPIAIVDDEAISSFCMEIVPMVEPSRILDYIGTSGIAMPSVGIFPPFGRDESDNFTQ